MSPSVPLSLIEDRPLELPPCQLLARTLAPGHRKHSGGTVDILSRPPGTPVWMWGHKRRTREHMYQNTPNKHTERQDWEQNPLVSDVVNQRPRTQDCGCWLSLMVLRTETQSEVKLMTKAFTGFSLSSDQNVWMERSSSSPAPAPHPLPSLQMKSQRRQQAWHRGL